MNIKIYVKTWSIYRKYNRLFHYLYSIDPISFNVDFYEIDFNNRRYVWRGLLTPLGGSISRQNNIYEFYWYKMTTFLNGEERAIFIDWPNIINEGVGYSFNIHNYKNTCTLYRTRYFNINKLDLIINGEPFNYIFNERERQKLLNKRRNLGVVYDN